MANTEFCFLYEFALQWKWLNTDFLIAAFGGKATRNPTIKNRQHTKMAGKIEKK